MSEPSKRRTVVLPWAPGGKAAMVIAGGTYVVQHGDAVEWDEDAATLYVNGVARLPMEAPLIEHMVDTMHPGVGENDTLGAPYSFDRGLLRDFAARLIAAGYARRSDVEAEIDAAANCGPR